jgi:hypothetical protein
MLRTVIHKYTGKEHRAQFDDFIAENEMLINELWKIHIGILIEKYFTIKKYLKIN